MAKTTMKIEHELRDELQRLKYMWHLKNTDEVIQKLIKKK